MADRHINIAEHSSNSTPDAGYGHDGILQELPAIKTESQELAMEIIELIHSSALDGDPIALAGGHGYERKGYLNADALGGPRNSSYGTKFDDLFLQITVRIPYDRAERIIGTLADERIAREEAAAQAKCAEIDAKIAALKAERDAL